VVNTRAVPTPSDRPGRLAGKVAIITGAARGQGAAEGRRFAEEGAKVVLTDVLDTDTKAVAQEIGDTGGAGGQALAIAHDVTSEADWAKVVATATETFGGVDILVNNAAIYWTRPLVDESVADFERLLRVNLIGALLGLQAVVPAMKARGGGSIVNISSRAGASGMFGHGAYGMSKWGLRGMTQTAAIELGPFGIRVNAVLPGSIDTAMLPVAKEDFGERFSDLPLGRVGTAEEVAQAVLFLASDESSYLTGSELRVDGGLAAGRRPEAWRVNHLPT
jgi:3alpha(or 20beta)-hydroxysteroid dehydrogenase